jgi:hypothetical protein
MTEATPMTMPSIVSELRNPCARMLSSAERRHSCAAYHED